MSATDYSRAACRDVHTSVFFDAYTEPAKAICDTCPIKRACAEEHVNERFGVWGGTDHLDRGFRGTTGRVNRTTITRRSGAGEAIKAWVADVGEDFTSADITAALDGVASPSTIRAYLADMVGVGTLVVVGQRRIGGGQQGSIYRLARPSADAA